MSKSCDPGVSSQHHTHKGAIVTSSRILGEVLNDDAATLYIEWRSLPEEGPLQDNIMTDRKIDRQIFDTVYFGWMFFLSVKFGTSLLALLTGENLDFLLPIITSTRRDSNHGL